MELSEGWAPLADFLGCPVPEEPFPRANEAAAFKAYFRYMVLCGAATWARELTCAGLVTWAIWRWWP